MGGVTILLENAKRLLETATDSVESGLGGGDWTVFIGPEGGLQMIAGAAAGFGWQARLVSSGVCWSRGQPTARRGGC